MNKFILASIFIIIIIGFLHLYNNNFYKTVVQFNTIENFEDPINIAADTKEIQDQKAKISTQAQTQTNNFNLLQSDTYLKTINDILTNKVDVVDSKLENKLKQFETNEINFHTIVDKDKGAGSMNICNTGANGEILCSHIAHQNGSTYIRPGVKSSDIWLNQAKNINVFAEESTDIVGKNIFLRGTENNGKTNNNSINLNTANTNICNGGMCSHLPYTDGNSYIRPGNVGGSVFLGKHGQNVENVETNAKSVNLCSSITGKCSHFPWSGDQNTYIRPGKVEGIIHLGHDANTNDKGTSLVTAKAKSNQFCSSQANGQCSEFPDTNGDTRIRAGINGKSTYISGNFIEMEAAEGFCFNAPNKLDPTKKDRVCFTVAELTDIKNRAPPKLIETPAPVQPSVTASATINKLTQQLNSATPGSQSAKVLQQSIANLQPKKVVHAIATTAPTKHAATVLENKRLALQNHLTPIQKNKWVQLTKVQQDKIAVVPAVSQQTLLNRESVAYLRKLLS